MTRRVDAMAQDDAPAAAGTARHPMQPVVKDAQGTFRFEENPIVRHLLDAGKIEMNALAAMDFAPEDREHFTQIIGYSLSGFGELGYVSEEAYAAAWLASEGKPSPEVARIQALEGTLATIREGLRAVVPALFKVHPDELAA